MKVSIPLRRKTEPIPIINLSSVLRDLDEQAEKQQKAAERHAEQLKNENREKEQSTHNKDLHLLLHGELRRPREEERPQTTDTLQNAGRQNRSELWTNMGALPTLGGIAVIATGNDLVLAPIATERNSASNSGNMYEVTNRVSTDVPNMVAQAQELTSKAQELSYNNWFLLRIGKSLQTVSYTSAEELGRV